MTTYTFPADPIRVDVLRLPADRSEPDMLAITVFRGDLKVGGTDVYRGHLLDCMTDELGPAEIHGVNAVLLAEWAQWPEESVETATTLDLYEELCRLCRDLKPKEGA